MRETYFLRRLAVIIYTILLAFERAGSVVNCTVCIILRNMIATRDVDYFPRILYTLSGTDFRA